MVIAKKDQIRALLKSIETGDSESVAVVNEAKYIQHNPQTQEGSEGLAALFQRLSKTSPRVNIVRAFEDGDFVFAHTESENCRHIDYQRIHRVLAEGDFTLCVSEGNFGGVHTAYYDLFRFSNSKIVEHWDTTESIAPRDEWKNDNGKF